MQATHNRDYSISCARFIAMCFIIICHMMQRDDFASNINGAHISWAFWFNVGVQMFLFLSGYLYGGKDSIDTISFYKKNFPKLLIDYYIFIFIMLVVIHFSPLFNIIPPPYVIALITFSGTAPGLGHLWFIPTILFCYLLTPIFYSIISTTDKHNDKRFWVEILLFLFLVHEVIIKFFNYFDPTLLNCYIIGMIYSRIESKSKINIYFFHLITALLCIITIPIQFKIDYWPHNIELPEYFVTHYTYFCGYVHVFLGMAIIFVIRLVYKKLETHAISHIILDWSDKYSYDIYLTHHVFIQSAFGCVEFINNRFIALPLAVFFTIISAIFLYHISRFIHTCCLKVFEKIPN